MSSGDVSQSRRQVDIYLRVKVSLTLPAACPDLFRRESVSGGVGEFLPFVFIFKEFLGVFFSLVARASHVYSFIPDVHQEESPHKEKEMK